MRKVLALLIVVLLGFAATAEARAPTVLVLPGGGWQVLDSAYVDPVVNDLRAHGYRALSVGYPLGDPVVAIRSINRVANRIRGPVVLYGHSAGGTIAAALAASGQVDGAVNVKGPTDLLHWDTPGGQQILAALRMTRANRLLASPLWRLSRRATPQLTICGQGDTIVGCRNAAIYAVAARRRQIDSRLIPIAEGHAMSPADTHLAVRWIQHRWPV